MKKLYVILACLVLALFVLSACKPEGSFSVVDDSVVDDPVIEDSVEDSDSGDVFEELENLDELDEELDEVVEEEPERVERNDNIEEELEETETKSSVLTVTKNEGELVKVKLNAKDPDGDTLTFTYEKPLDENGEWQTEMGDDGKYYTTVTVSDGQNDVEVDVLIEILSINDDPVLAQLSDIVVDEGETVRLEPEATDADGDEVSFTYSGWMKSATYKTNYKDAGAYKVTVTASDGNGGEDSQTITVTVKDVNRAPIIEGLE
ncbi:hypothetical protein KY328_03610 [Candidatus Woesearchaeota archaeon]|nr:hypothetical protein [Candidatus Woesearchaeota archaeon]MBW3021982.1 hypothetical protein [Candidatus Woesearchaeota archaeon]